MGEGVAGGDFVVGGVFEALEIAAPGDAEAAGGLSDFGVNGGVGEVAFVFKEADVPGGAEVVVAVAGAGVGEFGAWGGAAFGVEGGLS